MKRIASEKTICDCVNNLIIKNGETSCGMCGKQLWTVKWIIDLPKCCVKNVFLRNHTQFCEKLDALKKQNERIRKCTVVCLCIGYFVKLGLPKDIWKIIAKKYIQSETEQLEISFPRKLIPQSYCETPQNYYETFQSNYEMQSHYSRRFEKNASWPQLIFERQHKYPLLFKTEYILNDDPPCDFDYMAFRILDISDLKGAIQFPYLKVIAPEGSKLQFRVSFYNAQGSLICYLDSDSTNVVTSENE
jgi:hypothetical protein